MAPSTVSSNPVKGRWSIEYRTALHLLYTRFTYTDDKAKLQAIPQVFRKVFAADLAITHPNGLTDYRIKDDYQSKHLAGRTSMYEAIVATTVSHEQGTLNETIMTFLVSGVTGLSLQNSMTEITTSSSSYQSGQTTVVDASTNKGEITNAKTTDEQDGAESAQEANTQPIDKSEGKLRLAVCGRSNTTENMSQSSPSPVTQQSAGVPGEDNDALGNQLGEQFIPRYGLPDAEPKYSIPMLHYSDFFWQDPHAAAARTVTFVDPSSDTYKLGGKVYRGTSSVDGTVEDLMICQRTLCPRCKTTGTVTTIKETEKAEAEAKRINGLPFVHTYDCFRVRETMYFYFSPRGAWPYTNEFSKSMWRTQVALRVRGSEQGTELCEVMLCDPDLCEQCKQVMAGEKVSAM